MNFGSRGRNCRELAPRSQVCPDLEKERQNCPFSQEEITNILDGGPEKTAERRGLEEYFFSFPEVSKRYKTRQKNATQSYILKGLCNGVNFLNFRP